MANIHCTQKAMMVLAFLPFVAWAEPCKQFSLADLRVTGGKFLRIQEQDRQYLLSLDTDRLLSYFRVEAGLKPKAEPYGGWESINVIGCGPLSGHSLCFYLSAMAMMYESTGDETIRTRLAKVVGELAEIQRANGGGYLMAGHDAKVRECFRTVASGDFSVSGGVIENHFEPTYVLNKLMLGLYDVYRCCGNAESRDVLVRVANWFGTEVVDKLDHDQLQRLLTCEHGSLSEGFALTYELTGDRRHLEWAKRLNDERLLLPLSNRKDPLVGMHANTQIQKFSGFAEVYRVSRDERFLTAAEQAWKLVVGRHSWANGGNSVSEHFVAPEYFKFGIEESNGPETCNSVNMMRLTEKLYGFDSRAEYVDYYERVIFSHIAACFEPERGMCCYYTPMRPAYARIYGTPFESFWCCTGTGMQAPAKFAQLVYAHTAEDLCVNLFMPSTVRWREKGVKLSQSTRFPDEDSAVYEIVEADSPVAFSLNLRIPRWVRTGSVKVELNGSPVACDAAAGSVRLNRTWQKGDVLRIGFDAELSLAGMPDGDDYLSVSYGPVLLAAPVGSPGLKKSDYIRTNLGPLRKTLPMSAAPHLFGSRAEILSRISRIPGEKLAFEYKSRELGVPVRLVPFNEIHYELASPYFPHVEK